MSDQVTEKKKIHWQPLESNPEVLNQYISKLGISPDYQFVDVFGLDPELLVMVPKPCCAMIFLIPITENYKNYCQANLSKQVDNGDGAKSEVFYMKQTIGNACGTIGVIHALANNKTNLEIKPDSPIAKFLKGCEGLSPEEKGKLLESDVDICSAHSATAQEGQTEAMNAEKSLDLHFVALVHNNGILYELDGRKPFPVQHGKTTEKNFLNDAAAVCKGFMARDKDENRFAMVALSKA